MTQAISLSQILRSNGHEIKRVLIGKSKQRQVPQFFFERINAPVSTYESPNFILTKNKKGIRILKSILLNLKKRKLFYNSIDFINQNVTKINPDIIINFYEILAGLYYQKYNPKIPHICIAHHYLINHPDYVFPKGYFINKLLIKLLTRMTSLKATLILALSYVKLPDIPSKKLFIVPPLVRKEVLKLKPVKKDFILGYMLYNGYGKDVLGWHNKHPETPAFFFWDKKDEPDKSQINKNLFFYRLDDKKFLEFLKDCSGFISTAGFESICEAMYLEKPLLIVPGKNHFEQKCNSFEAERVMAANISYIYDPQKLIDTNPIQRKDYTKFKNWVRRSDKLFLKHLMEY